MPRTPADLFRAYQQGELILPLYLRKDAVGLLMFPANIIRTSGIMGDMSSELYESFLLAYEEDIKLCNALYRMSKYVEQRRTS